MNEEGVLRLDRSAFSVVSLCETTGEKDYWLANSPNERLEAVELMRQIKYGYDPTADRLQRVLEVAQLQSR